MQIRSLTGALTRVVVSLLFAGLFYTGWLAVFLGAFKNSTGPAKAVWWMIAPVVTAAGFAVGLMVSERLTQPRREGFIRMFIWPLVGCILGAVVVVWFGPMLIVFGMFLVGTGSVTLREFVIQTRSGSG
jgi:hypothetical protein